jgi:epimerase transport system membrane fusion protein
MGDAQVPVAPSSSETIDELVNAFDEPQIADGASRITLDPSSDRYQRLGLTVIAIVFGGFGLWAMIAPLDSAAFASGVVQAEGYRKPVQSFEGGIVERIDVSDGQHVELGQALLYLDDTATRADLGAVEVQLFSAWALLDRLTAERDDFATVTFSTALLEYVKTHRAAEVAVANERALFDARRADRLGERSVLEQKLLQLDSRLEGLNAIYAARVATAGSLQEEVDDLRELLAEGFVDKVRLRQLERTLESTLADITSTRSDIAGAEVGIQETKLRIDQLNKRFKTEVIAQLSKASAAVVDYEQRHTALQERLERTVIKASATGLVLDLAVNSIGQVIRGGETLMEIVPDSKELVVKAQISPADIDSIEVGDEAEIRFSAFKRVFTVTGKLMALSADRLTDPQTGMPYYDAEVDIYEADLALLGDRKILPGMPADVLIKGEARTLFQYLMKPVDNIFSRALIEE